MFSVELHGGAEATPGALTLIVGSFKITFQLNFVGHLNYYETLAEEDTSFGSGLGQSRLRNDGVKQQQSGKVSLAQLHRNVKQKPTTTTATAASVHQVRGGLIASHLFSI